jgi:putative membrane protein
MILEKKIPWSYFFQVIKWDVFLVAIFITCAQLLTTFVFKISIPIGVGTFMGTAIALILSFKLSQSYDRWWEARKIWGAIVNDSRSLVVQLKAYVKDPGDSKIKEMAYRQMAWCHSLSQNLRGLDAVTICKGFVSESDMEEISEYTNAPLALGNIQTRCLRDLHDRNQLNDFQQMQIDSTLVRLCASMGMAERIKNTYFPKPYRMTLHFFIFLFLSFLSFSEITGNIIVDDFLLILISIPFFMLEKIAFYIQDPFENRPTDTATTAISETIEGNLKQLLDPSFKPETKDPDSFYLM